MEWYKITAVAAFVLGSIAFIAVGNPHIAEEQNKHSEISKIELSASDINSGWKWGWIPDGTEKILCTESIEKIPHGRFRGEIEVRISNGSGYCYYMETWKTRHKKLVFYGFELVSIQTQGRGESQ